MDEANGAATVLTTEADELDLVPLERLEAEICGHASMLAAATARWLLWIAAYDRRHGWSSWGTRSCVDWLSWHCGVSTRTAREHVRVGHALAEFDLVRQRFMAGELSYSKVRAITRVMHAVNEADLVDTALHSTASQLDKVVAKMRRTDRNEANDAATAWDKARVDVVDNGDGTSTMTLTLPTDEMAGAKTHLADAVDTTIAHARGKGESNRAVIDRLGGLRRVRAEVAGQLLDGSHRGAAAAPETLLVVDHEVLDLRDPDGECHVDHQRVAPVVARRLACDSKLQLALRDGCGDAVGIGTPGRVVNRRLRRLLARRDHGMCQHPGCEATQRLHAHHVIHWIDGGPTELWNLISLCSFHHHLVHEGGWTITFAPEVFVFVDPDGATQRVPVLALRAGDELPALQNGSAEPLNAPRERADLRFVADVLSSNTRLRLRRITLDPS